MANGQYPFELWPSALSNRLWPDHCLLCAAACAVGERLCPGCAADLPTIERGCPVCARPLARVPGGDIPGEAESGMGIACGACQLSPPPYFRSAIPCLYAPPVDYLVRRFKYDGKLEIAPLLASLMFAALSPSGRPDVLIPVPLHARRLTERGFNQALELARQLRRLTSVPYDCDTLVRVRDTRQQTALEQKTRFTNVANAFEATRPLDDVRVALIDDVVTTGATVGEAASVLLAAGARSVEVWAAARTP